MIQFYPWFSFDCPLSLSRYHTLPYPPQQRKRKLKPKIKLSHNIKLCSPRYFCSSSKALFPSFKITGVTTLAVRGDCSKGNRVGRRVGIYWRMDLGFEVIATSSNNPTWTTSVCSCERNHTMNRTVHILVLSTFQPSLSPTLWVAFTLSYPKCLYVKAAGAAFKKVFECENFPTTNPPPPPAPLKIIMVCP